MTEWLFADPDRCPPDVDSCGAAGRPGWAVAIDADSRAKAFFVAVGRAAVYVRRAGFAGSAAP